jgi:hypothetical protein
MLKPDPDKRTDSWLDGALDRYAAANEDSVMRTRSLLNRIIADPPTHARLVNTLSLLEHIGSHKIMVTQHSAAIDQPTLRHLAEEAHHAFFMKRQAEKIGGRALEYAPEDLLAPATAKMYFQRLESRVFRTLEDGQSPDATYLYMSMIVEFRALWFYGLYQQCLKRAGHPMSLKRVLGEEQNHLIEMAGALEHARELSDARVDAFTAEETRLYRRMLDAIQRAVN